MGHSDFYINDALIQPNCPVNNSIPILTAIERNTLQEGEISPGCSHKRSFKYFIESLSSDGCVFLGIKCESYEDFKGVNLVHLLVNVMRLITVFQGKCTSCGKSNNIACRTFGLATYRNSVEKSSYYVNTAGQSPYCSEYVFLMKL